ncbi:hypothetical protein [Pedobacter soli]|uniref:Uncharacterized protein n=1 Tax=Pedobacter soli TaxID=390242 RepID=A0A1G7B159_9SPHI|nr:hypothetical protein [Pedobacter soli]SDE19986.1 hypothetical protein SAMN04488024_113106 [Pedobacter soli]
MQETFLLQALTVALLSKSGFSESTPNPCREISIVIFYAIDEYVSESTLKRIFGLIQFQRPSIAIFEILARYIGFEKWEDFLESTEEMEAVCISK